MNLDDALESLRLKFTSANSVPVNRAPISRDEYEAILAAVEPVRYTITEAGRAMLRDAQQSSPDRQQGE